MKFPKAPKAPKVIAMLVLALIVGVFLTACGSTATVGKSTHNGAIPAAATATLQKIDAGTWPKSGAVGTKGGTTWRNQDSDLPRKNASGKSISYKEWDVNSKKKGQTRDAQRIITGTDGSAWYTGDHYKTFTRMR